MVENYQSFHVVELIQQSCLLTFHIHTDSEAAVTTIAVAESIGYTGVLAVHSETVTLHTTNSMFNLERSVTADGTETNESERNSYESLEFIHAIQYVTTGLMAGSS